MARRRRVIFACKECDEALVWPSEELQTSDPHPGCLYSVPDGFYIHGVDPIGRETVNLHPDRMWKLSIDPSGRARCPQGHPVGTATTGQNPPPWFIALWTDKVTTRDMRGRV
jgi:hypothetical protein